MGLGMKISAGAILILTLIVWFLWKANEHKAEEIGILGAALAGAEATIEYQKDTAITSQTHADTLAALGATAKRSMEGLINERNRLRATAEARALEKPLDYGDHFEFELARVFCLFQAGSDRGARRACDLYPSEAYHPDVAITVTVTPELAERWREICEAEEEGYKDFCRWSITGFTSDGGTTILNHLERLAEYALSMEDRADTFETQLRELSAKKEESPDS